MSSLQQAPFIVRLGVDEGNHAEMPAIMAGGHKPGQLTRVFEKDVRRGSEVVRQTWKVMGTPTYGLPSGKDADVYYALMEISDEQRWPRKVHFSLYDLIERMGWNHGGSSYANARESLKRWATVRIESTNSYYVFREREYRGTHVWGFVEEAHVPMKDEMGDRSSPVNYVVWNEHFHQSVLDGYLFAIDLDLYRRLRERPLAKRLYTFLNKKFGKKDAWGMDIKTLAHTHLGIAESRSSPAQIRAVLDPAVDLLKEQGFLRSCTYRVARKGIMVWFRKGLSPKVSGSQQEGTDQIVTPPAPADDPLAWLHHRLFKTARTSFKKESADIASAFVAEHGREAWEEFAGFVEEYRRDHWQTMNSIGGALTLLPKFLDALGELRARKLDEALAAKKQHWRAYIDEQVEAFKASHAEKFRAFESALATDSSYRFWSDAAEGRGLAGPTENRIRHRETARDILRLAFAREFRGDGVKNLEDWLGRQPDEAQPELSL